MSALKIIKLGASRTVLILSVLLLIPAGASAAFTSSDLQSILNETPFYNPGTSSSCANGESGGSSSSGSRGSSPTSVATSGTWTSNLQPPYYLEEFAIQVLDDVAQKLNVPESSAVTEAHVDALVAWFWIEGGDIDDGPPSSNPYPEYFNVLNTSIQDPSIETTNASGGIESFNSFDDGVEGTARTIVGPFQSRIGQALTNPSNTAADVMTAIADYQNYPGNAAWASGNDPSDPAAVLNFNQTVYLPSLLTSLSQLQSDYTNEASTEMGTPKAEALLNERVSPSLLRYTGSSATFTSTSTNSLNCSTAASCSNSSPSSGTQNLSVVRQNVVCIAQQQYQEWSTGQLTPAQGFLAYSQGRYEEWCADFASWVYNQADYPLAPDPNWDLPGVPGIIAVGEANQNFHFHNLTDSSEPDYDPGYTPQPGDLAIIPGQHVEIVVAVNGNNWTQIGGDEGDVTYYGTQDPPSQSYVDESIVDGFTSQGVQDYVSPD